MMKDPVKVACRIFVGNLPTDDMERKDLKDLFSKFGIVTGKFSEIFFSKLNERIILDICHMYIADYVQAVLPFKICCRCTFKQRIWFCSI